MPPHTHPKPEIVTIIEGTVRLGTGETAESDEAEELAPGPFFAMEPGMAHYVYTDGEAVVQVNSVGPWGITCVDPAGDPVCQAAVYA